MEGEMPDENSLSTGYAPVNDLRAYFEIHGEGEPLLLLHGAYMNVDGMAPLLRPLAEHRQVIALDLQGHGRTADADRPITYEGMADDTAAVMEHLGIERADVVGYSMGAGVGLQMAIRHPERVRKLVAASTAYAYNGMPAEAIVVRLDHVVELFQMLGGAVMGDLGGLPKSQARGAPGHLALHAARLRCARPRRADAGDDPAVPRRRMSARRGCRSPQTPPASPQHANGRC